MSDNEFVKPKRPFLLLTEDGNASYWWWDTEEKMKEDVVERRELGERIVCAIEIASYRDIEIPLEYTVDDLEIRVE